MEKDEELQAKAINGRMHILMGDNYMRVPLQASDIMSIGEDEPRSIPKAVIEAAEQNNIRVSLPGAITQNYIDQVSAALVLESGIEAPKENNEEPEQEFELDIEL